MPSFIEKAEPMTLPVLTLRGVVAFPKIPINFDVPDDFPASALKQDAIGNSLFFLVCTDEDADGENDPDGKNLCLVGTAARIKQMLRTPEGQFRVIAEGVSRAVAVKYRTEDGVLTADVISKSLELADPDTLEAEALAREMRKAVETNARYLPSGSEHLLDALKVIDEPGLLADFIASNVLVRNVDRQHILECFDPIERSELLLTILGEEASLLEIEAKIRRKVTSRLNRNQQEFFLREQIKAIQEELGEGNEVEEYAKKIKAAKLPKEIAAKLNRENDRLSKTPYGSAEATVIANYLDVCLEIPWTKSTKDTLSFDSVQKILDEDHFGLEKVKERIVEYIAAKQLSPELKNQILCLAGPPGVGKTSVASSIARAMNRKFVRISLGGVRDEADIRGHRKTYIGAMPGRIITAVTQAGVRNPLILLDEIDKLTSDAHGDPTSALLEVLDGEQNKAFRDHFVEMPFDLSDCVFIATANDLANVPRPLRDRMEIIELGIYTKREKLEIAKRYLIPKQMKRHGLKEDMLSFSDDALVELIDYYTHEAGVRSLERAIAAICRKTDKRILTEKTGSVTVNASDVEGFLGVRKLLPEKVEEEDEIGCVNGLAYTELGGSMLKVEAAVLEGTGKIETTGSLGDVMKESAQIAVSVVRSIAKDYNVPTDFYKTRDIHIHFPEGAVPKDGPSAGVTMVTALVSALSGRPVRHDVAMTGEISLRGKVLAIGGLKEKTMAAFSAGAKTVLIPFDNTRDLEEIDPMAKEGLRFIPCKSIDEVLREALLPASSTACDSGKPGASQPASPSESIAASANLTENGEANRI